MKVMVTGGTGFVGRHVVSAIVAAGANSVSVVARNPEKVQSMSWHGKVTVLQADLSQSFEALFLPENKPDVLIHLAWSGVRNYRDFFHIDKNLPADLAFLQGAVRAGVSRLIVAGTCLEYGMQNGPLTEEMETRPSTPYGFAKDTLRKALQLLQEEVPFNLQWMRMFYMYGEGQNANSLLAKLDSAIDEGLSVFNMSHGDQLRDYLPIQRVAELFLRALRRPDIAGVINCCSGVPVSVLDLVQRRVLERDSCIALNRGYYPYPNYEPMAFWGVPKKIEAALHLT